MRDWAVLKGWLDSLLSLYSVGLEWEETMSELLLIGGASASSTFRVDLISVIGHTGVTSGAQP